MTSNLNQHREIRKHNFLSPTVVVFLWSFAAALESLVATLLLITTPRDLTNVFILGLSKGRWLLLLGLIGLLFAFGSIAIKLWRNKKWGESFSARVTLLLKGRIVYSILAGMSFVGLIIFSQLFHLAKVIHDPFVQGYLVRLIPYFFLGICISAQTVFLLPVLRYGFPVKEKIIEPKIFRYSAFSFMILLVLFLIITLTGIGITPDITGWDAPGVPVLPFQVGLVWSAGCLFLLLINALLKNKTFKDGDFYLDIIISLLIWGMAVTLWSQEALVPAFFNPEPRPPNFEYYPHSDAALHDTIAQSLLIGDGFPGIARKPLYALFLALLHGIRGQSYSNIIPIQVAVIGLFPVFLYWLAKKIHHRISGLIAAGFIILREVNALKLAGVVGVSHSKMLMSDLPATVLVVMITWLLILWVNNPARRRLLPMGIGGSLGLLLLLRPQSTILVLAVFLLIVLLFLRRPLPGLINIGLVTIGLLLTLTPWLWRSFQHVGRFALNDPSQMAFLTQQYRLDPGKETVQRISGESEADFIERINNYLRDFTREYPGVVVSFIASHFAHNQIEMIQVLPMSFWIVQNPDSGLFPYWKSNGDKLWDECCSVFSYVDRLGYWDPRREPIQTNQLPPMVLNLFFVSVGIGAIWFRRDFAGWIPLGVSLAYSMSTAVGRYSGWRLILPSDWVVFLYFAIGIGQVSIWLYAYYKGKENPAISSENRISTWQRINTLPGVFPIPVFQGMVLGLILLVFGLAPVIVESAIPERYPTISKSDLLASAFTDDADYSQDFLSSKGSMVLQGRALYPRYFKAEDGEPGNGWPAFAERSFARLGFILLSDSQRFNVLMPMTTSPDVFPNASDVIVVGCHSGEYIDAAVVTFMDNTTDTIIRPRFQALSCPLPMP